MCASTDSLLTALPNVLHAAYVHKEGILRAIRAEADVIGHGGVFLPQRQFRRVGLLHVESLMILNAVIVQLHIQHITAHDQHQRQQHNAQRPTHMLQHFFQRLILRLSFYLLFL